MPWLVSVTTEEDVKEDEDVKEQDEEDDEDDEEAEEDKDDGSTHSIVVADLNDHEAPWRENVNPSRIQTTRPDEPGEDEGKCEGDQDEEKKKRRKPNTCLPQSNQRSNKV